LDLLEMDPTGTCIVCPSDCINGKCDNKGYCTEGCVPGAYGPKCDKPCSSHCDSQGCDVKHAGALQDGWCKSCIPGWMGKTCLEKCHSTCVECEQGVSLNGALWDASDNDKHCTKCRADQPTVTLNGRPGQCSCARGAAFSTGTKTCECSAPEDETKEAHFELEGKFCRDICKRTGPIKYVEVFGDKKSDCLPRSKERIIQKATWNREPCDPTNCKENECKFNCEGDACSSSAAQQSQGYFCVLKEYVDYIAR